MCFVDLVSHREGRNGMPYGTGSCTYCACIAKRAFLSIFHFLFYNLHDLTQEKITRPYRKKNYTTRLFFLHDLCFSRRSSPPSASRRWSSVMWEMGAVLCVVPPPPPPAVPRPVLCSSLWALAGRPHNIS